MMNVAQILQGLSYKVCSTMSPNVFECGLFILVFGILWNPANKNLGNQEPTERFEALVSSG